MAWSFGFRFGDLGFEGLMFRDYSLLGFGVLKFGVSGSGFRIYVFWLKIHDLRFATWGVELRMYGL